MVIARCNLRKKLTYIQTTVMKIMWRSQKGLLILDCGWAKCVQSGLNRFFSNFQLYSRLQFVFNARKSHTKPQYLFVLGCEDDLSAWARQRCCPLTQSWKSDEMKTTSLHEPGRDVALSRSPERRSKMKTTSPSQQIPASLTELSLVDQFTLIFGLCTKPNSVTGVSL